MTFTEKISMEYLTQSSLKCSKQILKTSCAEMAECN